MKLLFRKIFEILLFLSFLLLFSCQVSDNNLEYNFKQGNGELEINFVENAPPEIIYPNSEFKVIVKTDNKAAYDVNNGKISIVGLDPKYFQLYPRELTFSKLEGKSITNPLGETSYFEFLGNSFSLFQNADSYSGNYKLAMKYSSKIDFIDTICINPNLYDTYNSGCNVENSKSYNGQGGPLAITDLSEIIYPGSGSKVEFRMTIRNMGRGEVLHAYISNATLGGEDLDCIFKKNELKYFEFNPNLQETVLVCQKSIRSLNSYNTILYVEINYDYKIVQEENLLMESGTKN